MRKKTGSEKEDGKQAERNIVEVWNYLRVQKKWNPAGKIYVTEVYDEVNMSRPTLYSCLRGLSKMDLVELNGLGKRGNRTYVRVRANAVLEGNE